jgi:hypothetical protein
MSGIVQDSNNKPRLLSLYYETNMSRDLRLWEAVMSLRNHEYEQFSGPIRDCMESQRVLEETRLSGFFTSEMMKRVPTKRAVVIDSDSSKLFYFPRSLGVFAEDKGKELRFGLKIFRSETPTIKVPISLKKPTELIFRV